MSRLKIVLSIGIIIILSVLNYVSADDFNTSIKEDALIKAFNETDAKLLEINVNFSEKINDTYLELDSVEKLIKEIVEKVGIDGSKVDKNLFYEMYNDDNADSYYYEDIIQSDDLIQLTIWGKDKYKRTITVIISSYKNPDDNTGETDLVIDIVQEYSEGLKRTVDEIKNIYSNFNTSPKITTCIIGTFDGKLNEDEKIKKVSKALNSINGRKVEGLFNDSLISISAYSPLIDEFIYTGNNKMNVNIALRYNEYEDKTYIWIGTPIISIGY
ncbi:YwmB family TATA-box binding protein [Caloranaerobacter azorensis]|uniref:YwmB family TATA-box binding protein n=1 Tax=Caloranaerobacter azorensis TaxID=116090 RepID=A0A6P1YE60_9FIRM|nr:YwmB family TATA-box binding protein [Caloranaerobacter azorensis]QIB27649.1 YwmB family TATA-box binding protein [Caloranaerobacter azorensis]